MDTIYALSSGALRSAVAVVRVSGPAAGSVLQLMVGTLPEPGRFSVRNIRGPDGGRLDTGGVLWMPGPGSFTGEDVCELQVHGSRAVIDRLFDSLSKQGLRAAEPGEFTRRAFANGKLDLTEVEGLADLISAETEQQRRQALDQANGALRAVHENWRSRLIGLSAQLEARLDFSDEGDVPADLPRAFWAEVAALRGELSAALGTHDLGERVRDGFRVAIIGAPNAGKSSLLNALAQRDVAIVTDEPGTTRDILEVQLNLGGFPVRLFDTAGQREAESAAEREGIRRSQALAERADLVIRLFDVTSLIGSSVETTSAGQDVVVISKIDLAEKPHGRFACISSRTGKGVPELLALIERRIAAQGSGHHTALLTRERHLRSVEAALRYLDRMENVPDEVVAHLLQSASEAIGRLSGRVGIEDVLDRLFGEFCIGK